MTVRIHLVDGRHVDTRRYGYDRLVNLHRDGTSFEVGGIEEAGWASGTPLEWITEAGGDIHGFVPPQMVVASAISRIEQLR